MVYWDDEPPWLDGPVVDALRSAHVGVTRVSEILPIEDPSMRIDLADAHPSAAAHDTVARWIVTHRLDRTGG